MEILEIQMKHFGKFTDQNMSFHSGVNVIYGENETGKSTMHAFIKGMLYGISRQRGRAAQNDEYTLRKPWEGGGSFGGSIRFKSGGKVYRLERNFDKKEKSLRLFCESDGREAGEDTLELLLDGMNENTFENTVCINQKSAETDEGLAVAVRNFMVNAQSGGDAQIDVKKAMEQLQKERRELEKRRKQRMTGQIAKSQEIRMRMDYAVQELEQLRNEERQYEERLARSGIHERKKKNGSFARDTGKRKRFWRMGKIAMAVLAAAALGCALVTKEWTMKVICSGIILLASLGVWGCNRMEYRGEDKEEKDKGMEEVQSPGQKIRLNLEWVQGAIREKERLLQELEEQYREIQSDTDDGGELEESLSAVYLAIDTLEEVTAEIYDEYARRLNGKVSEILAQITGGRYTSIYLDECLQVKVCTPQRFLEIGQVSRGTMEQIYFALRMAAAEILTRGEPMPVLLDDAFAMYDNTRLEHTLQWLCSCGHQVLLFTCQKREQEILQKIYAE